MLKIIWRTSSFSSPNPGKRWKSALIIGRYWPEKSSSAAGVRTLGIIQAMKDRNWSVSFFSPAKTNQHTSRLHQINVQTYTCRGNDETAFNSILQTVKPDLVICDQFLTEEQYGWNIRKHSQNTTLVIDTQDLHFLRYARESANNQGKSLSEIKNIVVDASNNDLLRELSSIHRADLTLVCSTFEQQLLVSKYSVLNEKVKLASFFYQCRDSPPIKGWKERKNFFMIGNFRHTPNKDSVQWMLKIWPHIRKRLPKEELHIYGAYPDAISMQMTDPQKGFVVKGPIKEEALYKTIAKYRISLAPLRFGAGIKGKISDSWFTGTPVVTTPIGTEGMTIPDKPWGGFIARTEEEIVEGAVSLYENSKLWLEASLVGRKTLETIFNYEQNAETLIRDLEYAMENKEKIRKQDITGEILKMANMEYTQYFSRWIELREKLNKTQQPQESDVPVPTVN